MKLIDKICELCHVKYLGQVRRKFCSVRCRNIHTNLNRSPASNRSKGCDICDTNFKDVSKFNTRTSCSKNCQRLSNLMQRYGKRKEVYKIWKTVNKCQICLSDFKNSKDKCIDHCHQTGYIRGILCSKCNTALGLFQDDVSVVSRANEYLAGEFRDNFEGEYK